MCREDGIIMSNLLLQFFVIMASYIADFSKTKSRGSLHSQLSIIQKTQYLLGLNEAQIHKNNCEKTPAEENAGDNLEILIIYFSSLS